MAGRCRVVVGVGLNVLTPVAVGVEIDQPWADLRGLGLKASVSRNQLASRMVKAVLGSFDWDDRTWMHYYSKHDALVGRSVEIIGMHDSILGLAKGVQPDGGLIVNTDQGDQIVRSGEVSVRPHAGL